MQEAIVFSLNVSYGIISLALLVLGLAIIFGLLGVLNMAHGELVAIGAYTAWAVQSGGGHRLADGDHHHPPPLPASL